MLNRKRNQLLHGIGFAMLMSLPTLSHVGWATWLPTKLTPFPN